MLLFTVDAQDPAATGCQTCCCEKLALKPGTTSKVSVGYAPWAVPIGELHCKPQFQLELLDTCLPSLGSNLPPEVTSTDGLVTFSTALNTLLNGDLKTKIADPEAAVLTFKPLPLYGPKHGKLTLYSTGLFDYDPTFNYVGEDRFWVSASDGTNDPVVFEVMIAVGVVATTMVATPKVSIGAPTVDQRYFVVSFPVTMSPAVAPCEVWRLTVLQGALDCSCACYSRADCFDIAVAKC
jgi:hypothetical protein